MSGTTVEDWKEERDEHISQIASELIRGRVGFLVGAGMSIHSEGIPGSELAFQLLWKGLYKKRHLPLDKDFEDHLRNAAGKFPLEAVAEGVMHRFPFQENELEELLKNTVFQGKTPVHNEGHDILAAIVARFGITTLFTTNWDNLIEQGLGLSGEAITESKLRNLDRVYDAGNTAVIHLHGTFDDNPLIREEDLMDPDRPLFQLFMAELMTKAFVFVGYSLSDFNIRALYSKARDILTKRTSKLKKYTYIVAPPKNEVDRKVSSEVWRHREAIYLPMDAQEFFRLLYNEAAVHKLDELKERLKIRLNISLEDLQVKIDEILGVFPDFKNPEQVLHYLDAITRGGRS